MPNFKIVCDCIHELLNVFEDPAQRVHTIWREALEEKFGESSKISLLAK